MSSSTTRQDDRKTSGPSAADLRDLLPVEPGAAGPSIVDRQPWVELGTRSPVVLKRATQMLAQPSPDLTDDLYLECSQTGSRTAYELAYHGRLNRLTVFALAECIENNGQFLAAIEGELHRMLVEKTWVMPAHDSLLDNFHGRAIRIDLGAAIRGASIATIVQWLGDRLNSLLRRRVVEELQQRLFAPYLEAIRHPESQTTCRWLKGTSNWNAVCTTGVVIAALAALPDREGRAEILAGALGYLPFYLEGFTVDGYCSEGLGYWNFGFSYYVTLAEWLLHASSGRLDLYRDTRISAIARYPDLLEMSPGIYPALADCELYSSPLPWLRGICGQRLWDRRDFTPAVPLATLESEPMFPHMAAVAAFSLNEYPSRDSAAAVGGDDPLRGWFPEAGVLVCRSRDSGSAGDLSACFKGGHNAEHHNHNDIGSFVAAVNGRQLIIDPGKEIYTRDTFGPKRYSSVMMNSFGHSVPVVAGILQSEGSQARGKVLNVSFSDDQDRLELDLASAYDVPSLRRLERVFSYQRNGGTKLSITDFFEFSTPETFEEALITTGRIDQKAEGAWVIREEDAAILVTLESGCAWEAEIHPLPAQNALPKALRLAIRLRASQEKGTATLTVQPLV